MTEADAAAFWRGAPKVELHLHLEGAAPPALSRAVAARRGVDVAGLFDDAGGYAWAGFAGFLAAYDRVAALYATPEDEAALAEAVLRACAAEGVIYAEVFLSPDHAGAAHAGFGRWAEHLAAVSAGADAAERATGIVARFIPLCVRHLGPEAAVRAATLAARSAHPRVVGFGMAGDERRFAPADFAPAFAIAREAGLGLTAHAGEFGGPDSVRAALDALGLARIGHGVRAIEDAALTARLAAEGVMLEVCPGSNIALGLWPDRAAHPLRRLRDAGVRVSLSTDDPPFFGADMTREYAGAAASCGWDAGAMRAITADALAAAFCDDALKARLAARLG